MVKTRPAPRRRTTLATRAGQAIGLGLALLVLPLMLWMVLWSAVILFAAYYLLKVLPCLIWDHFRSVWRTFGSRPPGEPSPAADAEPAQLAYTHRIGPRPHRLLWRDFRTSYAKQLTGTFDRDYRLIARKNHPRGPIEVHADRFVGLVLCAYRGCWALVVTLVAAFLLFPGLLFVLLAWATLLTGFRLCVAACSAVDRVVRRLTATVCPHPDCGRAVALPVRLCPSPACEARHRRLVPGRYGVVRRTCRCGVGLPAASVFGARRLKALCPHCSRPLLAGGSRAALVLVAGGPGSGRSTVVRSGLAQLAEAVRPYGGSVGGGVSGTGSVELHGLRGGRRSLALLDPNGPAFAAQSGLDAVDGLRRAHGLLLVVDVLALSSVRRALTAGDRDRIGSPPPPPGQDSVQAAERVLRTLAAVPARRRPKRITVVLAKTAVLRHTSVGRELAVGGDDAVRRWLEEAGAGNLVRSLDRSGIPVRYLADGPAPPGAAELGGLLLWTAGITAAPRRLPALPALRLPRAVRRPLVLLGGRDRARHALRLSHLLGFVSVPLAFSLLFSAALPPSAFFGLPTAFDRWQHPLAGFDHETDLAAYHRGVSWPTFRASYSASGSSPAGPRDGALGFWSTEGSPNAGKPGASDWLEVDFGLPIQISRIEVDLGMFSDRAFEIQTQRGGDGWQTLATGRNVFTTADPAGFPVVSDQVTLGVAVSAIRIVVPEPDPYEMFSIDGLSVWSPSNTLLRLRPDGSRLLLTNTVNRAVAVQGLPPVLPPGWRAVPDGPPPRRVAAGATVPAGWRITADADARPGPVGYTVRVTDNGHTATATCVALLRMTSSGPAAQPVTCAPG